MPEEKQILRPCPACGSEDRKTCAPGIRVQVAMLFDYSKLAICKKCGCMYEYRTDDARPPRAGVGVSIHM